MLLLKFSSAASRSITYGLLSSTTGQQAVAYATRVKPSLILLVHLISLLLPPT